MKYTGVQWVNHTWVLNVVCASVVDWALREQWEVCLFLPTLSGVWLCGLRSWTPLHIAKCTTRWGDILVTCLRLGSTRSLLQQWRYHRFLLPKVFIHVYRCHSRRTMSDCTDVSYIDGFLFLTVVAHFITYLLWNYHMNLL